MNRLRRHLPCLPALGACAALIVSCSAITIDSLPQPGVDRNGYDVVFEFASVLNLPGRAKVVLDGVTVGTVTDVEIVDERVDVTSRIRPEVLIPADIHAVLQQPTVLGDIYLALQHPATDRPGVRPLVAGARVPLAQTTSPPQIEDTIANLANFVTSGAIQRVQNTMIRLNQVADTAHLPLSKVVAQVTEDLSDLADNIDAVDLTLHGLAGTATVLDGKRSALQHWFSPAGMLGFDRTTQVLSRLSVMIPSIGSIYSGGFWLVPMLTNIGDATGAVQATKWAVEDEYPRWRRLLLEYFLPTDKYPAINITSIVGPDGREMSQNVQDVLRILGAVP